MSAKYQSGYLQNPTIQICLGANLIGSLGIKPLSNIYDKYTHKSQTTGTLYIYQIIYVDDI